MKSDPSRFAELGCPRRVWAVGAVHGEVNRLVKLHDQIAEQYRPGDRLVYLGNLLGHGSAVRQTLDEVLEFRRQLLACRGMLAEDIVFLRGQQEEMWLKLLHLQLAPDPAEVLDWMLRQGLEATLTAYGGRADHGRIAALEGPVSVNRWCAGLREVQRETPGHASLMSALRRCAFTVPPREATNGGGMLLVSAGLDPGRPLEKQADAFWWAANGFRRLQAPYEGFRRVVRGFDPARGGIQVTDFTVTLDAGAGLGGPLACAVLTSDGTVQDILQT